MTLLAWPIVVGSKRRLCPSGLFGAFRSLDCSFGVLSCRHMQVQGADKLDMNGKAHCLQLHGFSSQHGREPALIVGLK